MRVYSGTASLVGNFASFSCLHEDADASRDNILQPGEEGDERVREGTVLRSTGEAWLWQALVEYRPAVEKAALERKLFYSGLFLKCSYCNRISKTRMATNAIILNVERVRVRK